MTRHPFGEAWESRNVDEMVAAFAPDGVLHSPVGDGGFKGAAAVAELLNIVHEVTSDAEITHEWRDGTSSLLAINVKFNGKRVHGILELELDDGERIRQMWMYVRPLTGVIAVAESIGPAVVALRSPAVGRTASILIKPLVGMAAITNALGIRTYDWVNRTADSRA